jgi:hypothetical protein
MAPGAEFPDIRITLRAARALDQVEVDELTALVEAWYSVGLYGAFGGHLHNLGPVARKGAEALTFAVDFGSAEAAMQFLIIVLEDYARAHDVPLAGLDLE